MKNKRKGYTVVIIVSIVILFVLYIFFMQKTKEGEQAKQMQTYILADSSTFNLEIKPVVKTIEGKQYAMYSYHGQIPGPLLKVKQHSKVFVNVLNTIDQETTIH